MGLRLDDDRRLMFQLVTSDSRLLYALEGEPTRVANMH
jgi:hypothetical protein